MRRITVSESANISGLCFVDFHYFFGDLDLKMVTRRDGGQRDSNTAYELNFFSNFQFNGSSCYKD